FPNELIDVAMPESVDDPYFGGSDVLNELDKTIAELRGTGGVVHAVSLSGNQGGLFEADGLFALAPESGGTLVESTDDLAAGFDRALAAGGLAPGVLRL